MQDGIAGLADMDATFPYLQAQRTAVESGDPDAAEPFGAKDESSRSNLLLPSMNQVWPQLVPCLRHTQPAVHLSSFHASIHSFHIVNCEELVFLIEI
jgi:hypothetical protein